MAVNRRPRPGARLPVGWALTLAFDFVATALASLAMCAVGLLLPGITEDYGPAGGPTSPTALAAFAIALVLIASLAVTVTATRPARAGAERARSIALWISAGRLALLVTAAAAFVTYGILTVDP
ncbi:MULTISPECIES: hypothetical protein [unclassified Streptomyces]|uniref:hypothetical protein n=1 Tax=unclassified Streptomyces TaxID=2593676 RepID=UPI0004BDF4E7|nr:MULTISPECIES: hypothetical protein [unclassified Streptomyces]